MTAQWTVRDGDGGLRPEFTGASALEVGRRILPVRYDAFRLQVSSSYREHFNRAVSEMLEREGWEIVRIRSPRRASRLDTAGVCAAAA